tara:strand:- start:690 stop:1469 length:780 start_codon:yes stop_codon:yes gene_type:complete
MALSDILKVGATLLGGGGNPIASLATNFLLSKALGADTKDAVKFAGLGTLLGAGLGTPGLFGKKAEQMSVLPNAAAGAIDKQTANALANAASQSTTSKIAEQGIASIDPAKGTLGVAPFLVKSGILNADSKTADLLNSPIGEMLLFGGGSALLDKLFSSDEEDERERPFGGVEGFTRLNVPRIRQAADGGYIDGQYFPRRNGGIMPSEGSGQKDDVPAMLMAGEFVLNKKAVKGLGDGDLNKGIERAYAMQNRLQSQGA